MAAAHGRGLLGLSWPDPGGLAGLLLSSRRGLLFLSPWLLLAFLGAIGAVRDRRLARAGKIALVAGVLGAPVLLSGFSDWHGGSTLGPRYLVFTLPLLGIAAAVAAARLERRPGLGGFPPALFGLVLSSQVVLLAAHLGLPVVDRAVANPVAEVVVPVLLEAGPLGTVLDPILGTAAGSALVVASAFLVLLGALEPRGEGPRRPRIGRAGAVVLLAAVAAHALVVALPRSGGPGGREAVLRARAHALLTMGLDEDAERHLLEIRRLRLERDAGD
jgi:hypothetical protein